MVQQQQQCTLWQERSVAWRSGAWEPRGGGRSGALANGAVMEWCRRWSVVSDRGFLSVLCRCAVQWVWLLRVEWGAASLLPIHLFILSGVGAGGLGVAAARQARDPSPSRPRTPHATTQAGTPYT